uniref:Uncharacterized protein n=1 Tax=viral metagenome TaxID=1070528 RepID=A0A6M3IDL5_9ZZZZ
MATAIATTSAADTTTAVAKTAVALTTIDDHWQDGATSAGLNTQISAVVTDVTAFDALSDQLDADVTDHATVLNNINGWGLGGGASDVHTNTVTETVLAVGATLLVGTVAANELSVGSRINIKGQVRQIDINGADTLTVKLYHSTDITNSADFLTAGTEILTSGAVAAADNDIFTWDFEVCCRAIGSGTTEYWVSGSYGTLAASGTSAMKAFYKALTALDSTALQYFGVAATYSAAHADNECQMEAFSGSILGTT